MRREHPFGLNLTLLSAKEIATAAATALPAKGVALVVTPNIDHIAMLQRNEMFRAAYKGASYIVCDGWPVVAYARYCGMAMMNRVTGCEIVHELFAQAPFPVKHRLFFVVDGQETYNAVADWANERKIPTAIEIPPYGFSSNYEYATSLATMINVHRTTILIMAVGAPRSEIFVHMLRNALPDCWAFCVGQAVKTELGLVQRASERMQSAGMEWLWRIRQEPGRLLTRYISAAFGFGFAVLTDQFRRDSSSPR